MKMTVKPHDLVAACMECNTTLQALSEETGLCEEELLAFAAGRIGLYASERLRILVALCKHAPGEPRESPPGLETQMALIKLDNELMAEESAMRRLTRHTSPHFTTH